ncbi:DUF1900-domain-containing protein [Cutaneotrichosporon oleaginosum]|uniref:DUF1900-domain-containing protein n=1 Tax=Cutaneotrichosporon oleaginosum TaxID=879819 RepID=A0A0J0XH66_9TREE|nr:DUF1900-domain-containing protein [Cutaneotrichosporon oleaginosum]KLT40440.1 DUF1900-domain-containing protein [Cutaneotrichosporon oleaginosum]TXT15367.1 hypothetical protein COLE_01560 [Cutaneotrichosporon oleaginosum]
MAPRTFGATKFRNAVPAIPARDEWYRTHLPPSSAAPPNTTAYSGLVKTTREAIITLAPSGDASVRSYSAIGESEGQVWAGKFGAVADWDASRLEDGGMVIAGNDGTATYYAVTDKLEARHSFTLGGKASSIRLHPTTAGLALAATNVVAVYDVAASSAALTLDAPAPLWSASWSPDGRLVGGVSKKGHAYVWDARAGSAPTQTRDLSSLLQALKPVHAAYVGPDLFVTSFSRSRTRQYSLLSADLSTAFTAAVDTSQGPLVPLVDEERRIVYASGRGDMTLRQIELSGPQGYQEMPHHLPAPLTAGGAAAAHWSTLPVMEAQIATLLLPTTDKGGDTLLPLGIKVPRRHLIDYHADLFPDVAGSVPEQSASEWLKGSDKAPIHANVDPERRGAWEKSVEDGKAKWAAAMPGGVAAGTAANATAATALPAATASAPPSIPTPTPVPAPAARPASSSKQPRKFVTPVPGLPPLEVDEDYTSTSYKVRIISDKLAALHKRHSGPGPLMVGLQGPQGCGKTTLCDSLVSSLEGKGLSVAVLSLDDLYRTHAGLKQLAAERPNNALLTGRGPPGTHDVELATRVLKEVQDINPRGHVDLPVFDKSLCGGEGDRSPSTVGVDGPLDIFVLEGWSFGFGPLSSSELDARLAAKDGKYFPKYGSQELHELNTYLAAFAEAVYPFFSAVVQIEPDSYEHVFRWRLQQEHEMKDEKGEGMSDEAVHAFVERYMPSYELWAGGVLDAGAPWAGNVLRLRYGKDREVTGVEEPQTQEEEKKATPAATTTAPLLAPRSPSPPPKKAPSPPVPTASPKASLTANTLATKAASPAPATTSPDSAAHKSYNPGWSRKYLAGKTPLIPTYDQIPSVATLHQDSQILRLSPHLAFFPVQGPGGRLLVHPLSKKGRLPFGGVGFVAGGVALADFAADPFTDRVVCAGEDGVLRVWDLPADGVEGAGPEPTVVRGSGVERIAHVAFHPTARDLLVVASNEHGASHLRFFDLTTGSESKVVDLPAAVTGFATSDDGQRVALSTKDGRILVWDRDRAFVEGQAHDSARAAQLAWAGEHLISLGFGRGSMRQLHVYAIHEKVERIAALSLDVSPSVLFPVYDEDTHILYAWGKGQQNILAFQIDPLGKEVVEKLPSFTAGAPQLAVAFLPKTALDVRKVEVAKCLRLTARSVEEVTFSVPRNRPQFFQDDIYVPTRDGAPATTAREWLAGAAGRPRYVSLRPQGMELLSTAPAQQAAQKKFVPAAAVMSEEQRKQKAMDDLFARAKGDSDSDSDDEPQRRGGIPPPDDDW